MKTRTATAALTAFALMLGLAAGCSSTQAPSGKDAQIPASQLYDVKIQPARIPPNPQGAFALSTATGCDVIYITKAAPADTVTYAVRPTSRVPDAAKCVESLRSEPGVESVAASM
jgi:hypothetical protein